MPDNPSSLVPSPVPGRLLGLIALTLCTVGLCIGLAGCCGDIPPPYEPPAPRRVDPAQISTAPQERSDGSVVLSKPGRESHLLTSDRKFLYWAVGYRESTQVMRVPKKGGKTRQVAALSDNITAILPDRDELYIATWGGVFSVPKTGGSPKPLTEGVTDVYAMTMDDDSLYYCASPGIHRLPRSGGPPRKLVGTERCMVSNLGVHDGRLYWIDNDTREIARLPVGGGKAEIFAKDVFPAGNQPIIFHRGYAYFYRTINTAFLRKKLDGGEIETITTPRGFQTGFAVDDEFLYYGRGWSNIGANVEHRTSRRVYESTGRKEGAGGVMRVPLKGGEPVNLCELTEQVRGIAVDDDNVYWLDEGAGIIARKPLDAR